jgi:hypothetical protein
MFLIDLEVVHTAELCQPHTFLIHIQAYYCLKQK